MDIKQINTEYQKFQTLKTKVEANISKIENEINSLVSKKGFYTHLKSDLGFASKYGYTEAQLDAELSKIDNDLNDKKKKLQEQKDGLKKFQADLDKTMENVKQDPDIAAKMDEILAKRYDRQLAKLEEKKEKIVKEQKNMDALVMANRKSPFMEKALKDILILEIDKKKLITDMNLLSTSDPDYATKVAKYKSDIKNIEKKEEGNKKSIITAIKMEKGDFTDVDFKAVIDRIGQNMTILKSGDIQLDETLNRTLSAYKRQLNGIDKQKLTNTVAYAKLNVIVENSKSKTVKEVQDKVKQAEEKQLQASIEAAKKVERDKLIDAEKKRRQSLVPVKKPKWFQFVKRFQQWRNGKRLAKMPSIEESLKTDIEAAEKKAEQDVIDANAKAKQTKQVQKNNMRDVYKFDVVQQIISDQVKQKWTDAKKTVKDAKENSER